MITKENGKVELLAPGGDADSVKAAIYAGADAVYCGLSSFNARQRASNLTLQELEHLTRIAAQRNCRIYLTLNTLVFDHEIPDVLELLKGAYQAGIRVVIVQDLGLLHILRKYLPEIEVHASTQMTTHNEGQISFLSQTGVSQVNLSRELSISEIESLCSAAHEKNMKVEVFVHGAFCISFSGQCYMSSGLCGKSGNRGECVQPCRRQYLLPNSKNKTDVKAVFNLKDNFAFADADKLYDAGVDSFKIEGRIKKFLYVYNVTSAWREQVDALEAGNKTGSNDKRFETVFNRKYTAGYINGTISADMFIDTSRDQSLKFIANVSRYWADKKILTLSQNADLSKNTELLIYTSDFTFICKGLITQKITAREYSFDIEHKLKGKINEGYQVFTQDSLNAADSIKSKIDLMQHEKVPLRISVSGSVGSKLKAVFRSPRKSITLFSEMVISEASQRPLDHKMLHAQFSRLGTSQFVLECIDISELQPNSFIPQKELNRLRREAVESISDMSIDLSRFEIPLLKHGFSTERIQKKAYFIDDIPESSLSEKTAAETVFIIPNRIKDVDNTADRINRNKRITPFFSSILIGEDFTRAVELLLKLDGRTIITDNSGIADVASRSGIKWIAGPAFNIVNSYAIEALLNIKGFCGLFLSPEFSEKERGPVKIPSRIEVWSALNLERKLMTTRQCLIRNISGCNKKVCDDNCLLNCDRSATIANAQGKRFRVVKKPGFYTTVYF
ncbi:MAG: U32 family peptidase [Fibrobacter sp.]|nr:U32 family peptidase [Fibrobacter sp.]